MQETQVPPRPQKTLLVLLHVNLIKASEDLRNEVWLVADPGEDQRGRLVVQKIKLCHGHSRTVTVSVCKLQVQPVVAVLQLSSFRQCII